MAPTVASAGLDGGCPHCSDSRCDSTIHVPQRKTARVARTRSKVMFVRALALTCACSLSVGSHYGSYFLGPLKSRLSREIGTDNTQFSLLIAAYNLNSTWTPLVGGLLVARLGTTISSIIATSLVLLGQSVLLIGSLTSTLPLMALGMFIFGLGISPINVVQETIIVRFFSTKGLGVSLALGLMAGKGASFISAITSFPLSEISPHAPFIVSTMLAFLSFVINLIYISFSEWFAREAELDDDAAALALPDVRQPLLNIRHSRYSSSARVLTNEEAAAEVAEKRQVKFSDITLLGDVFWAYIAINVLCGAIWSPFAHLAANIIERRYQLTEMEAGKQASLLLAGSVVLYPICGYLTDRLRRGPIVHVLFVTSSILTLFCYAWLVLPPNFTQTPTPGMISFGTGHGFSTLLLVIIVPHLVPLKYVSTALGAHKSIEQAGSTISQTLAGFLLDKKSKTHSVPITPHPDSLYGNIVSSAARHLSTTVSSINNPNDHTASLNLAHNLTTLEPSTSPPPPGELHSIQLLLNTYFFINILQSFGTLILWRLDRKRKAQLALLDAPNASPTITSALLPPVPTPTPIPRRQASEPTETWEGCDAPDCCRLPDPSANDPPSRGESSASVSDYEGPDETRPLLTTTTTRPNYSVIKECSKTQRLLTLGLGREQERRRGRVFAVMFVGTVVTAWAVFMGAVMLRLHRK